LYELHYNLQNSKHTSNVNYSPSFYTLHNYCNVHLLTLYNTDKKIYIIKTWTWYNVLSSYSLNLKTVSIQFRHTEKQLWTHRNLQQKRHAINFHIHISQNMTQHNGKHTFNGTCNECNCFNLMSVLWIILCEKIAHFLFTSNSLPVYRLRPRQPLITEHMTEQICYIKNWHKT